MRIENRFGSVTLKDETAAVVNECIMQSVRMVKYAFMDMMESKDLASSVTRLAEHVGPDGTLPFGWMRDSLLLMAFRNPSVKRPLLKANAEFFRKIGKFRIMLKYEPLSDSETGKDYFIEFSSYDPEMNFGKVVKRFVTEDEAIKEYFNAKEYMHMFLME